MQTSKRVAYKDAAKMQDDTVSYLYKVYSAVAEISVYEINCYCPKEKHIF
jgi:hypothetical protein